MSPPPPPPPHTPQFFITSTSSSSGMEEEGRSAAICPLVEIDFLGLEQKPQQQQQPVRSNFVKSIRDIQKAASRLSPDLLRYVISGHNNPQASDHLHPFQTPTGAASLTFLYNGSVSVIQTTTDTAEDVMKMAETEKLKQQRGFSMKDFNPTRDLPLFRTKSLQRFFEKRRERLKSVAPYSVRERLPSTPTSSSSSSTSSCCSSC